MAIKIRLLILGCLFGSIPFSFTQGQESQPVRLNKLSDKLYEILGGRGAQGGMFVGEKGIAVIDAKMDSASVARTIREIKKISGKPILFLVNTHSDRDHVTGNRYFPETATIVAHENCRTEMLLPTPEGKPSEWSSPAFVRFLPSVTFRDKMEIFLGADKIELRHFGAGHTTGDAVAYIPEEKTAFIGDLVFLARVPLIHAYKGGSSVEEVKTLKRMLDSLDAERFCSGHSEPVDRTGILNYIDRMEEYQNRVKSAIQAGKNIEAVKSEFKQEEEALIEIIFNEIQKSSH